LKLGVGISTLHLRATGKFWTVTIRTAWSGPGGKSPTIQIEEAAHPLLGASLLT